MSNFLSSNPNDLARALEDEKRDIEERETQGRAGNYNLPYVNLLNFPLDLTALAVFSEEEASLLLFLTEVKSYRQLRLISLSMELKKKISRFFEDCLEN